MVRANGKRGWGSAKGRGALAGCGLGVVAAWWAVAGTKSDVSSSRHNLSVTSPSGSRVKANSETEICIFCHTPHGATTATGVPSPLWNRQLSSASYTKYTSNSFNAEDLGLQHDPEGSSKLCLSCHDGTLAVGSVNVKGGSQFTFDMGGTGLDVDGTLKSSSTGLTRDLGTDLTNDHPISFSYNSDLASADGELRTPPFESGGTTHVGNRATGVKPTLPLQDDQVECSTCHDPHLVADPAQEVSIKFLRLNRFQAASTSPTGGNFNATNDIICLACHAKGGEGWSESAHALPSVANETYKLDDAVAREFSTGSTFTVSQAACLNCHDTHTVVGSRRLLREGNDSGDDPKTGGNPAIEETCYQCHSSTSDAKNVLNSGGSAPNIMTEFTGTNIRMPITTGDQATTGTEEPHNIKDADFTENQATLGVGSLSNRHVECTDCHNPHRVMKDRLFNGNGTEDAGTHLHSNTTMHTNIASGVLRGTWGVEPDFGSNNGWMQSTTSYIVKQGDGGAGASDGKTNGYVTREYQVCFKCHTNYGFSDNGVYPSGNRPTLGSFSGGTSTTNANGLTIYTNQAAEFNAAANDSGTGSDQGETTADHRSWHPVLYPTGRTLTLRGGMANNWTSPWNGNNSWIGTQTMYCSDCHGAANTTDGSSSPASGKPWGPHGSSNKFILRGDWGGNNYDDDYLTTKLCFKCHSSTQYAGSGSNESGFSQSTGGNLHNYHNSTIGKLACSWCHIAVPHGWKYKALLVNLNCVTQEAGKGAKTDTSCGTQVRNGGTTKYSYAPYYWHSVLKVKTFNKSGDWNANSCGSRGAPGNNTTGVSWMRDSGENCANPSAD